MKKFILISIVSFIVSFSNAKVISLYKKDGIQFTHNVSKLTSFYCSQLNSDVIIWKSIVELKNSNSSTVLLQTPCKFKYIYSYMNPSEIERVQNCYSEKSLSDIYKNIITTQPTCLKPRETMVSEKYFVTFDNVNLSNEIFDFDLQYVKQ